MSHLPVQQAENAHRTREYHPRAGQSDEREFREYEERGEARFNKPVQSYHRPPLRKLVLSSLDEEELTHNNTIDTQKRAKTRIGLPLRLDTPSGLTTVLACADTGSEENILSDELAQSLGYSYNVASGTQQFMLANGNIVESIGCITMQCSFGNDDYDDTKAMACIFHVLLKLATPLIVGMAFLEETKTLVEHRDRLVRVARPAIQALNVYSVGRPRKRLHCRLNEDPVLAIPDTGSEVDLMSPQFASERGLLTVRGSAEMIEFADGSVALTSGIVQATLQVTGGSQNISSAHSTISVEFLLLDTLVHDVLIGEDSLEQLRVFTGNQDSLYPVFDMTGPLGLNSIRYLGAFDRTLKWVKEKLGMKTQDNLITDPTKPSSHKDQKENNRREREATRIAGLPGNERKSAIAAEAERQAQYDYTPYYCPQSGCHREESGKGFQELIELNHHVTYFHSHQGWKTSWFFRKEGTLLTFTKHEDRI